MDIEEPFSILALEAICSAAQRDISELQRLNALAGGCWRERDAGAANGSGSGSGSGGSEGLGDAQEEAGAGLGRGLVQLEP